MPTIVAVAHHKDTPVEAVMRLTGRTASLLESNQKRVRKINFNKAYLTEHLAIDGLLADHVMRICVVPDNRKDTITHIVIISGEPVSFDLSAISIAAALINITVDYGTAAEPNVAIHCTQPQIYSDPNKMIPSKLFAQVGKLLNSVDLGDRIHAARAKIRVAVETGETVENVYYHAHSVAFRGGDTDIVSKLID